jgi:hypothetical protein
MDKRKGKRIEKVTESRSVHAATGQCSEAYRTNKQTHHTTPHTHTTPPHHTTPHHSHTTPHHITPHTHTTSHHTTHTHTHTISHHNITRHHTISALNTFRAVMRSQRLKTINFSSLAHRPVLLRLAILRVA